MKNIILYCLLLVVAIVTLPLQYPQQILLWLNPLN